MVNNGIFAAALLQLVALAIFSTALLVQTLRTTERRLWRYQRFGFGVAAISLGSFVCAGIATAGFFFAQFNLTVLLRAGLLFTLVGLASFLLFIGALYDEYGTDLGRE